MSMLLHVDTPDPDLSRYPMSFLKRMVRDATALQFLLVAMVLTSSS